MYNLAQCVAGSSSNFKRLMFNNTCCHFLWSSYNNNTEIYVEKLKHGKNFLTIKLLLALPLFLRDCLSGWTRMFDLAHIFLPDTVPRIPRIHASSQSGTIGYFFTMICEIYCFCDIIV